jgi:hypothetical protein
MTYQHRPKGVWLISSILGGMAALQMLILSSLLVLEPSSPAVRDVIAALSVPDLIGLYSLAVILLTAMVYFFRLRKRAVPWFAAYIGLGSWAALAYSITLRNVPHFNELVSLGGLLIALAVLTYMLRLRRQEKLI